METETETPLYSAAGGRALHATVDFETCVSRTLGPLARAAEWTAFVDGLRAAMSHAGEEAQPPFVFLLEGAAGSGRTTLALHAARAAGARVVHYYHRAQFLSQKHAPSRVSLFETALCCSRWGVPTTEAGSGGGGEVLIVDDAVDLKRYSVVKTFARWLETRGEQGVTAAASGRRVAVVFVVDHRESRELSLRVQTHFQYVSLPPLGAAARRAFLEAELPSPAWGGEGELLPAALASLARLAALARLRSSHTDTVEAAAVQFALRMCPGAPVVAAEHEKDAVLQLLRDAWDGGTSISMRAQAARVRHMDERGIGLHLFENSAAALAQMQLPADAGLDCLLFLSGLFARADCLEAMHVMRAPVSSPAGAAFLAQQVEGVSSSSASSTTDESSVFSEGGGGGGGSSSFTSTAEESITTNVLQQILGAARISGAAQMLRAVAARGDPGPCPFTSSQQIIFSRIHTRYSAYMQEHGFLHALAARARPPGGAHAWFQELLAATADSTARILTVPLGSEREALWTAFRQRAAAADAPEALQLLTRARFSTLELRQLWKWLYMRIGSIADSGPLWLDEWASWNKTPVAAHRQQASKRRRDH